MYCSITLPPTCRKVTLSGSEGYDPYSLFCLQAAYGEQICVLATHVVVATACTSQGANSQNSMVKRESPLGAWTQSHALFVGEAGASP